MLRFVLNRAIQGQAPSYDLRATLSGVSSKFRQMTQKAAEQRPPQASPPGPSIAG